MQIALGQAVLSSDGHKIGTIDSVLLNPDGHYVEHIVVHRGIFLDDDKVVARDLIDRIDSSGAHLTVDAAAAKTLPRFDRQYAPGEVVSGFADVVPGPFQSLILFTTPPPGQFYLEDGRLFQLDPAEVDLQRIERAEAADIVIGKGADVIGSDGERIGYVHEVAYGDGGTLETVVVQTGLVRHHRLTIPAVQIAEIGDEKIVLSVPAGSLTGPE